MQAAREYHKNIGSPAGAVAVLATTGMAVSVLDGGALTINSFLGTFNLSSPQYHLAWERSRLVSGVIQSLRNLRVFVLDEGESRGPFWRWSSSAHTLLVPLLAVSMLPEHGLGYLNFCLQQVRQNVLPFGGVQGIFVGDFFQVSACTVCLFPRSRH